MHTLEDSRVKTLIIAVLAVLALFLLAQSVAVIKGIDEKDDMMQNAITVRGTGEAVGIPDIATFTFTVRESGKDVTAVQQAMATKVNKAIDYVKQQGIEEKDIKVVSYYTNPTYEYSSAPCTSFSCPPSRQTLSGYEVAQTVSVKARGEVKNKAGEILTGIAALKVGEVSSLSMTIDDLDALKLQAKEEAIEKAKVEAGRIAKALGVDLDEITSFYEEYPYEPYGYEGEMDMGMSSVKSQGAVSPQLPAGEQKVTATVSITYKID